MATRVRSYSKINLGLAIGPVRGDGFHGLTTLYQTLALHDVVTVSARLADSTRISLTTNHRFVPTDGRNTAWKMVERALARLGVAAEVEIQIEKNLPVQGGMGAGSANAAAALLGLERELGVALPGAERLRLAGEVGSDVPLFLLGGAVMGLGRGEMVVPMPDLPRTWCVVAVPEVGVSTPQAFRDWDALVEDASGAKAPSSARASSGTAEAVPLTKRGIPEVVEPTLRDETAKDGAPGGEVAREEPMSQKRDMGHPNSGGELTGGGNFDRLSELSFAYASLSAKTGDSKSGTSGIVRGDNSEKKQGLPSESPGENQASAMNDLAENTLLALVRTGIGNDGLSGLHNDFEDVVFPQYPSLRITKRQLMGSDSDGPAIYAALSGSGSALFGLYRSEADAWAAQRCVQNSGVKAFVTATLPRVEYWADMFAE